MQLTQLFLSKLLFSGYVALFVLFATGCDNEQKDDVNLRLTSKEKREIDTLVSNEVKILRPYYDSLCQTTFEKNVAAATDSIVQRRLEDELRLRARIPLTKNEQR